MTKTESSIYNRPRFSSLTRCAIWVAALSAAPFIILIMAIITDYASYNRYNNPKTPHAELFFNTPQIVLDSKKGEFIENSIKSTLFIYPLKKIEREEKKRVPFIYSANRDKHIEEFKEFTLSCADKKGCTIDVGEASDNLLNSYTLISWDNSPIIFQTKPGSDWRIVPQSRASGDSSGVIKINSDNIQSAEKYTFSLINAKGETKEIQYNMEFKKSGLISWIMWSIIALGMIVYWVWTKVSFLSIDNKLIKSYLQNVSPHSGQGFDGLWENPYLVRSISWDWKLFIKLFFYSNSKNEYKPYEERSLSIEGAVEAQMKCLIEIYRTNSKTHPILTKKLKQHAIQAFFEQGLIHCKNEDYEKIIHHILSEHYSSLNIKKILTQSFLSRLDVIGEPESKVQILIKNGLIEQSNKLRKKVLKLQNDNSRQRLIFIFFSLLKAEKIKSYISKLDRVKVKSRTLEIDLGILQSLYDKAIMEKEIVLIPQTNLELNSLAIGGKAGMNGKQGRVSKI